MTIMVTIEELYPQATDDELEEARHRLESYLRLIIRIQRRRELENIDETTVIS